MLNLQKLHDRLHGTKEFSDIEWLKQSDDVMASLDKHCSSYLTVRNYLNAVIVALLNREDFATVIEKYQSKRDSPRESTCTKQNKSQARVRIDACSCTRRSMAGTSSTST